jgi:hypothetical protein
VQTKQLESPSLLPTLDALDAEFESEAERYAAGRNRGGGDPIGSTFRSTQSEFPMELRATKPTLDALKQSSPDAVIMRQSLGRRVLRRLTRILIVFCVGTGSTLAWQSYGDDARAMIANSSQEFGWWAPQTVPVVPTAPDVAAPIAASPDLNQLALGLAAVRQSVDQLRAQLAAAQQQMGGDIAKLQADEQAILSKLSAAPPRPSVAPARKPVAVTPPPSPAAQAR